MRIKLLLLCLLALTGLRGQEIDSLYLKMYEYYASIHALEMTVEMKVYNQVADQTPSYVERFKMIRNGQRYCLETSELLMVYDDEFVLTRNDEAKSYIITKRGEEDPVLSAPDALEQLQIFKQRNLPVQLDTLPDGLISLTVDDPEGLILSTEVHLRPDCSIARVIFSYNEELQEEWNRVIAEYSPPTPLDGDAEKKFDLDTYLAAAGNGLVAKPPYQEYRVTIHE